MSINSPTSSEPEKIANKENGLNSMKGLIDNPECPRRKHAFLILKVLFYVYQMQISHPYYKKTVHNHDYKLIDCFGMDESNLESILKAIFGTKGYSGDLKRDIGSSRFATMIYDKVLKMEKSATAEEILPLVDDLSETVHRFTEITKLDSQKLGKILDAISEIKEKEKESNGSIDANEIERSLNMNGIYFPMEKNSENQYELKISLFDVNLIQKMNKKDDKDLGVELNPNNDVAASKARRRLEGVVYQLGDKDDKKNSDLIKKICSVHALGPAGLNIGPSLHLVKIKKWGFFEWLENLKVEFGIKSNVEIIQMATGIDHKLEINGIYEIDKNNTELTGENNKGVDKKYEKAIERIEKIGKFIDKSDLANLVTYKMSKIPILVNEGIGLSIILWKGWPEFVDYVKTVCGINNQKDTAQKVIEIDQLLEEAGIYILITEKFQKAYERIGRIIERLSDNDAEKSFDLALRINGMNVMGDKNLGINLLVISRGKNKKTWPHEMIDYLNIINGVVVAKKIIEIDQQLEANGIYASSKTK